MGGGVDKSRITFKPDRAKFFRSFRDELDLVDRLAEQMLHRDGECFSEQEWLFLCWSDLHDDDAGRRVRLMGAGAFYKLLERATRDAQVAIETIIREYLADRVSTLDPIDEVASCDDPLELLAMVAEDRADQIREEGEFDLSEQYPIASKREQRSRLEKVEACRKLAIAFQLLSLEVVDPMGDVSRDLSAVNKLVAKRLFCRGHEIRVMVNCVLNAENSNLPDSAFEVTLGSHDYGSLPPGRKVESVPYACRVVVDEEHHRRFLVQSKSRPKEAYTTIIKLARRPAMDRRGIRHIVIAVCEDGVWRVATREDVEAYSQLARKRLWVEPLHEEPDTSSPNQFSSSRYWNVKIVGRLVRKSRRGAKNLVAPAVEHQMTSLDVDLMNKFATDGTSHDDYRRRVINEHVLHEWFSWHLDD